MFIPKATSAARYCQVCNTTKSSQWYRVPGSDTNARRCFACYEKARAAAIQATCQDCKTTKSFQWISVPGSDTNAKRCYDCYQKARKLGQKKKPTDDDLTLPADSQTAAANSDLESNTASVFQAAALRVKRHCTEVSIKPLESPLSLEIEPGAPAANLKELEDAPAAASGPPNNKDNLSDLSEVFLAPLPTYVGLSMEELDCLEDMGDLNGLGIGPTLSNP